MAVVVDRIQHYQLLLMNYQQRVLCLDNKLCVQDRLMIILPQQFRTQYLIYGHYLTAVRFQQQAIQFLLRLLLQQFQGISLFKEIILVD